MAFLRILWAAAVALTIGCLGVSPQEEEPTVQGDYDDGDEEHRPGQPCLLCHGTGHLNGAPGGDIFEVAGTVFGNIDDPEDDGLENVVVTLTDSTGFEFSARTNRAGNFMFDLDTGASAIRERDEGRTTLPQAPVFPLSVTISRGSEEQEMKTKMWRNGSCAHCHGPTPDQRSVGRVYLFEATP